MYDWQKTETDNTVMQTHIKKSYVKDDPIKFAKFISKNINFFKINKFLCF